MQKTKPRSVELLPVISPVDGRRLYMATAQEIRELSKSGLARIHGSKTKIHCAVMVAGPTRPKPGSGYVHRNFIPDETEDSRGRKRTNKYFSNARGVYAFHRIQPSTRILFQLGILDCLSSRRVQHG